MSRENPSRLRRWWQQNVPNREGLARNRVVRPVAPRVLVPALWRFTRRSVPAGVALGLWMGIFLMVPGLQIAGAALLALPFRANIPVAAAMTFLSNPATTPFIVAASIYVGNVLLGRDADVSRFMYLLEHGANMKQWSGWLFSEAAPALLGGLFIIATLAATLGYVLSIGIWRLWISRKWRKREKINSAAVDPATL